MWLIWGIGWLRWRFPVCTKETMAYSTPLSPSFGCFHSQFIKIELSKFCTKVVLVLNTRAPKDSQMSAGPLDVLYLYFWLHTVSVTHKQLKENTFWIDGWKWKFETQTFLRFSLWWRQDIKNQVGEISNEASEISKESLGIASLKPLKAAPSLICDWIWLHKSGSGFSSSKVLQMRGNRYSVIPAALETGN